MKIIICGFLILVASQASLAQKTNVMLFDFEDGTLEGWKVVGQNPLVEARPLNKSDISGWSRAPVGFLGNFYLETGADEGRHTINPDGALLSPEFKISRDYLNFYLAGEVHPLVRVYLLVDKEIVRQSQGNNFYDLQLRGWNVKEFKGKKAKIVIEDRSDMRSMIRADQFYLSSIPPPAPADWVKSSSRQRSNLMSPGEFKLIFSNEQIGKEWKIVRSSIVYGPDNKWHLFVSAYKEGDQWNPKNWNKIFHATSNELSSQDWKMEGTALTANEVFGETFLWDPFVMVHDDKFYMFYVGTGNPWSGWYTPPGGKHEKWHAGESGDQGPFYMYLAVSEDGKNWERKGDAFKGKEGVIFVDNPFAFAPFVTKLGEEWVMYYASADGESVDEKHAIGYRTSKDLIHWSDRKIALKDWEKGDKGAPTGNLTPASPWPEHSFITNPVVFQRDNKWYLLAGPIDNGNLSRYHVLRIFTSDSPYHWDNFQEALQVNKRIFVDGGARPVQDKNGDWYISTTNDLSGGVWLAPLQWNEGE